MKILSRAAEATVELVFGRKSVALVSLACLALCLIAYLPPLIWILGITVALKLIGEVVGRMEKACEARA